MKLYEVPRDTRVRLTDAGEDTGKEFNFKHLDGMYSYCTDDQGHVVHLACWCEVEIV